MQLIGQFDSPFVRRVAIAMRIMGLPFEHRPWSVFRDADKIAPVSPLLRVPVLVLDSGQVVTESWAIVEQLEASSDKSLWPQGSEERASALGLTALATGLADKAVSLVYEYVIRDVQSELWVSRCTRQITEAADALEKARASAQSDYLFGDEITHADIALGAVRRFVKEAHGERFDLERWPAFAAHSARCEAREDFRAIQQPFHVSR